MKPEESFANRLLGQDAAFQSRRYKDHRMQLELKLTRARVQELWAFRIAAFSLVASFVLMFLCGSRVFGSADPWDRNANPLSVTLGVLNVVLSIIGWVGIASYYSRFRPATRQITDDLRDESVRELREEIRQLREMITGKPTDIP